VLICIILEEFWSGFLSLGLLSPCAGAIKTDSAPNSGRGQSPGVLFLARVFPCVWRFRFVAATKAARFQKSLHPNLNLVNPDTCFQNRHTRGNIMRLKKWLSVAISAVMALSLAACAQKDQAAQGNYLDVIKKRGKLVAGVKYDTYLFGYKDPQDGQVKGFEVDLMKELAKRMLGDENKLVLKEVNSKTRIKLLKGGDIDLICATMTISTLRKKEVDFSRVYFMAGQSLLVPKNSPIKNVKDTAGKRVATAKGATSGNNIKALVPNVNLQLYENYADAFSALRSGRVDALTTDDSILMGMEQQDPRFKIVGGDFTQEPYGIAVDKSHKDLLGYVNKFLDDIMKDGTYAQLYRKWFKKDPPKNLPRDAVQQSPTVHS
jgi:putative glutamine transport system substrate-binding protein